MKVTLLGDSIRLLGYGRFVPELLGEDYEVFQPEDNCRFAKHTLRGIFDWSKQMEGSRIVHWNNGLWDCCDLFGDGFFTSEEEYVANMLRIADLLLSRHDKVIFATTTPVSLKNVCYTNSTIERYNEILVPKLQEKGVIINDLYRLVATDIDRYIAEDLIHLAEDGARLCARQVANVIQSVADSMRRQPSKADADRDQKIISTGAPV